jgi:hypothetical protein
MRAIGLCTALLIISTPALAAWNVTHFTDRMTDKSVAVATVSAPPGTLRVTCSGPDIIFDSPIAFGHIGMNYRFDTDEMVPRIVPMASDGRTAWVWLSSALETRQRIARAKRLRVEIFPVGLPRVFMDFDLTGANEAIKALGCQGH